MAKDIPITDILGESLVLPDELLVLSEEDFYGFPSRPTVLPDEMLGGLLLPSHSDSGSGSRHTPGTGDTSYEDLMKRELGGNSSLGEGSSHDVDAFLNISGIISPQAGVAADVARLLPNGITPSPSPCSDASISDPFSVASPKRGVAAEVTRSLPNELHADVSCSGQDAEALLSALDGSFSPYPATPAEVARRSCTSPPVVASPAPSSHTSHKSVGLCGSNANSFSQSESKSGKSHDWSLSDTDLKELLELGSNPEMMMASESNLVAVPETHEILSAVSSSRVHSSQAKHDGALSLVSPRSEGSSLVAVSHEQSGSSPPRSVAARSVPGSSPSGSIASRPQGAAATPSHSPPQSLASGATSKSLLTNWSLGTRSSGAVRSSGSRVSEIGGQGSNAGTDNQ